MKMGRRRKNEGLAEILVVLPWWVGVGLGVAGFVALRWIFPAMLPPTFKSVAPSLQFMAWFPLMLFGFLGLLSLARSKVNEQVPATTAINAAGYRKSRIEPIVNTSPSHLDNQWGRSATDGEDPATIVRMFDHWTVDALRKLEWKRFELLCAKYYEAVGFKSETIRCGADGGIDVKLFKIDPNKPLAVVQCKAWNSQQVGVKEVRELLGVMAHEKVGRVLHRTGQPVVVLIRPENDEHAFLIFRFVKALHQRMAVRIHRQH
jgi:restriction system protein